jgi:hypothetical protein
MSPAACAAGTAGADPKWYRTTKARGWGGTGDELSKVFVVYVSPWKWAAQRTSWWPAHGQEPLSALLLKMGQDRPL